MHVSDVRLLRCRASRGGHCFAAAFSPLLDSQTALRPSHEGYPKGGWRPNVMDVASISVVVLDPRIAPRDQATWAFTDGDDAMAMAGFLNTRIGGGKEIAWVEVVPFARKLNKKALRYLDCWADLAEEQRGGDERVQ